MNYRNLGAYLNERFAVVNMVLFSILYFTVMTCSLYFSGLAFDFRAFDLLGVLAVISFFFRLRVFDEIKDFKTDNKLYPHRVLQSGRIGLKELKLLAAILFISELIWSALSGWPTLILWIVTVGYSLLMRYEFFVAEYLRKRLVLYAISHMLIMPLVIAWIWTAWQESIQLSQPLFILMALSLLGGFSFELARKIHAPKAEMEGQDSYSKSLGFKGAIFSVLFILALGVAVQFLLLQMMSSRSWPYITIILLYFLAGLLYFIAIRNPAQKLLRKAELVVSLFMLVSYVSIIIEIVRQ